MSTEAKNPRLRMQPGYVLENKWRIMKILGEGAFGAVYEVQDASRPDKLFALKVKVGFKFLRSN